MNNTDKNIIPESTAHVVWHKFSAWLIKTFGKDLHGEWQYMELPKKNKKIRYRSFNDLKLSRRLVGYEVMRKIERYVAKYCPEIKIIGCDDAIYAGSDILLIPHPKHGITLMYIPQCTNVQNQLFLYEHHCKELVKALKEMSKQVYTK